MRLELLDDEVALGDVELFLFGVAFDTDDFHPVEQWPGNGVKRIGRGHEKHVRQVVFDVEEMVVECTVLFRVEHLEQGRGGIAAKVSAHLVDFVEHEDWILRPGLAQVLDDLARHGTDVGAAVAADLRLVAHPAQ